MLRNMVVGSHLVCEKLNLNWRFSPQFEIEQHDKWQTTLHQNLGKILKSGTLGQKEVLLSILFSFFHVMCSSHPKEFKNAIKNEKYKKFHLSGMPYIHGLSNPDCCVTTCFFKKSETNLKCCKILATFCQQFQLRWETWS